MKFGEALVIMQEGGRVRRSGWEAGVYMEIENDGISSHFVIRQPKGSTERDRTVGLLPQMVALDDWRAHLDSPISFAKPCPFCGGDPTMIGFAANDKKGFLRCDCCGTTQPVQDDVGTAVEKWNRRRS